MIGVVVIGRDQGAFLADALDSVAAQTPAPVEVIFVDDGSLDGSGDLARACGVRTIRTDGLGPGAARNAGARELNTELLTFLDADDRYRPGHHAALSTALAAPSIGAAYGRVVEFLDPERAADLADRFVPRTEPRAAKLVGAGMFRRSAFDLAGGFDETHGCQEAFHLISRVPSTTIPDVVLERRIHGDNMTIVNRDALHARYLASAREAIVRRREG